MGYYDVSYDFYNENSEPDRMGKGSTLRPFVKDGILNMSKGMDRLKESLVDILSTRYGTRFFRPEYGTRLYECLFENGDDVVKDAIEAYAKEDIKRCEPRVLLRDVKAQLSQSTCELFISYTVKSTGTPGSFVYTIERKMPQVV